ncbi:hypothetical protein [Rufibacter soli]
MKKYILYDKTSFWFILHYPKLVLFEAFKIEDEEEGYKSVKELLSFNLAKRIDPPRAFLTQSNSDWWSYTFCLPLFEDLEVYELK